MIVNFALTLTEWQCIQLSQLIVRFVAPETSVQAASLLHV